MVKYNLSFNAACMKMSHSSSSSVCVTFLETLIKACLKPTEGLLIVYHCQVLDCAKCCTIGYLVVDLLVVLERICCQIVSLT